METDRKKSWSINTDIFKKMVQQEILRVLILV